MTSCKGDLTLGAAESGMSSDDGLYPGATRCSSCRLFGVSSAKLPGFDRYLLPLFLLDFSLMQYRSIPRSSLGYRFVWLRPKREDVLF